MGTCSSNSDKDELKLFFKEHLKNNLIIEEEKVDKIITEVKVDKNITEVKVDKNITEVKVDKIITEVKGKNKKVSLKEKEVKLINYGLLMDNCLLNPITTKEEKYDRRTVLYKNRINEYYNSIDVNTKQNLINNQPLYNKPLYNNYNIIDANKKKKESIILKQNLIDNRLRYEKYIKNIYKVEFKKQNKF